MEPRASTSSRSHPASHRSASLLTARVKNLSRGKPQKLSTSQAFVVNAIDQVAKVDDVHLLRTPGGYVLELRGKSGEPRSGRAMQVSLKHRDFKQPVRLAMQTDADGRVTLGPLVDIINVSVTAAGGTQHAWKLGRDLFSYPESMHGLAGEVLRIPWMETAAEPEPSHVSLLETRGGQFVADRLDSVTIRNGFLELADLPAGDYNLLIKSSATTIRIRLTDGPRRDGYLMGQSRRLEDRAHRPLQVVSTTLGAAALQIQLANATESTRVHLFATRYVPTFSPHGFLGRVRDAEPFQVSVPRHPSLYIAGRNIGDEFRYIIDRKYQKHFAGNMLSRPSLLLNAWPIRKTTTGRQLAAKGERFGTAKDQKAAASKRAAPKSAAPRPPTDYANLDFLANSSLVRLNLRPDKQGLIELPRDVLKNYSQVHVVAVDPRHTVSRSLVLPEVEAETLDLRLVRGLDPKRHFTEQRQTTYLPKGKQLVIPDVTSSRFEIYDSLSRVYGLYRTLSKNPTLAEFRFVLDWPTLDAATKRQKYSKYACHELNFFLSRKDPRFFAAVVQPFLQNKKDKTFMDHWLLGNDLAHFLDPWTHSRLNIVERILLAERLEDELPRTRRHVDDLLALRPRNRDLVELLFETALGGRELEAGGAGKTNLGVEVNRFYSRLNRDKNTNGVLGSPMGGGGGFAAREDRPSGRAPAASGSLLARKSGERQRRASESKSKKSAGKKLDKLSNLEEQMDKSAPQDGRRHADAKLRQNVRQLFRRLDRTQEWVENNYYRLPIEQMTGELVSVSRFWNDYAHRNPADPFFSEHFSEAARSFPEMMFALAVLDLPFEAAKHKADIKGKPADTCHRQPRGGAAP